MPAAKQTMSAARPSASQILEPCRKKVPTMAASRFIFATIARWRDRRPRRQRSGWIQRGHKSLFDGVTVAQRQHTRRFLGRDARRDEKRPLARVQQSANIVCFIETRD